VTAACPYIDRIWLTAPIESRLDTALQEARAAGGDRAIVCECSRGALRRRRIDQRPTFTVIHNLT
jgi:hypothetical protein